MTWTHRISCSYCPRDQSPSHWELALVIGGYHTCSPLQIPASPRAAETAFHTRIVQSCFLESAGIDAEGLSQPLALDRQSPFLPRIVSVCVSALEDQNCVGMQPTLEVWEAPNSSCWFRWADSSALSQQESQRKGGAQRSQMGRRGSPPLWKAIRRRAREWENKVWEGLFVWLV